KCRSTRPAACCSASPRIACRRPERPERFVAGVSPTDRSPTMTETQAAGTVRLHRILAAPPARVFRAFVDPDALVRWSPPYGFTARMLEFEAGVGYRMAFTNFGTGSSESFRVRFVELVEDELLRHTDTFDTPTCPGRCR